MPPAICWKPLRRSASTGCLQLWREAHKFRVEYGATYAESCCLSGFAQEEGSPMKLRILLADDHEIVRRGLCALLQKHEGWEVCGEACDGREALEMAKQLKPDVVIVDIGMPNLNGLDTTRQLLQYDPHFKVIGLTITDYDQVISEALDAGARGFVCNSAAAPHLLAAAARLERSRRR